MKRRFNFVLALSALMLMTVVACEASKSSPPELTAARSQSASTGESTAIPTQSVSTKESTAVPPQSVSQETSVHQPSPTSDMPSAYEELLRTIPDTPETRDWIYIDDYALVRATFADDFYLPGPDDESIPDDWYDYSPPMQNDGQFPVLAFGGPSFFSWRQYLANGDLGSHPNYLAFDVRHINQTITTGPPTGIDIIHGRFDPEATDEALTSCVECPPLDRSEHGSVSYYSWGGDNEKSEALRLSPPAFDKLGRGGRIAVLSDYVFRTLTTSNMEKLIEAHHDDSPSLADAEEFRFLADGMSQLGAYTMLLSDETFGLDKIVKTTLGDNYSTAPKETIDKVKEGMTGSAPLLRPYQAFAVGAGKDDVGPYMALALVHTDGGSAEDNTGLLRQRIEKGTSAFLGTQWSEVLDDAEINSAERLVVAKLRGRMSMSPYSLVYQRDNLIVHE